MTPANLLAERNDGNEAAILGGIGLDTKQTGGRTRRYFQHKNSNSFFCIFSLIYNALSYP